jgi:hypothetical protein
MRSAAKAWRRPGRGSTAVSGGGLDDIARNAAFQQAAQGILNILDIQPETSGGQPIDPIFRY